MGCASHSRLITGFIALIVALVLIIIVSFSAVFILARRGISSTRPSNPALPRTRRYEPQYDRSLGSEFGNPTTPPAMTWTNKLGDLFTLRKEGAGTRAGHGWVQAGSGDEWDLDLTDEHGRPRKRLPGLRERERGMGKSVAFSGVRQTDSPMPLDEPFRPPPVAYAHSQPSTSSIHIDLNLPGPMYPANIFMPFSSVTPEPSIFTSTCQLPRSTSPETLPGTPAGEGDLQSPLAGQSTSGRASPQSTMSPPRTFPGGTKFIESL
jgi:hypothetical protein